MEKILLTVLLLVTTLQVVTTEETIYMKGNLSHIFLRGNGCNFKVNDHSSPSLVKNLRFCHLLVQAHQAKQPISIQVTIESSGDETNNFKYVISFLENTATWPSTDDKAEQRTFKYQLVGKVNDVRYYTHGNKCYIAIDTGLPVRNNNVYHYTEDYELCDVAVSAYYAKDTVTIMAGVDLHAGYTNDILDLKVTKYC